MKFKRDRNLILLKLKSYSLTIAKMRDIPNVFNLLIAAIRRMLQVLYRVRLARRVLMKYPRFKSAENCTGFTVHRHVYKYMNGVHAKYV